MTAVRFEEAGDREAIHAVHVASFPTALEAQLVNTLRGNGHLCYSLVALEDDAVVGHVGFSPVSLAGATGGVGLAPVAVLPSHRRRGIAAQLIKAGLAACEHSGVRFVVVLGDPAYYGRFGFRPASAWKLQDEFGGGEAFQALEVRPSSIPEAGGLVRYCAEFNDLEGEGPAESSR